MFGSALIETLNSPCIPLPPKPLPFPALLCNCRYSFWGESMKTQRRRDLEQVKKFLPGYRVLLRFRLGFAASSSGDCLRGN